MRGLAQRLYEYGTWVMLVLIIVQFTAAGAGLFSVLARNPDGATGANFLRYHAVIGPAVIGVLSLLLVIVGFIGRLPWRMTGVAASFIPLMILQSLFITPYRYPDGIPALAGMPWLATLHVVNALFIFWLAFQLPLWARRGVTTVSRGEVARVQTSRGRP